MIEQAVQFELPQPWIGSPTFRLERFGSLNFLVGPNGSGKSRFGAAMRERLPYSRLLGTDRLSGMERIAGLGIFGDNTNEGLNKGHFGNLKNSGNQHGFGIDAFVLLEERLDLRLQVEATLSQLFDRKIVLDWDSGKLVPKAILGTSGASYRLDKDECHGIKELLVLLAHIYNDEYKYLFIDEPELNLHPQYQSFLMQEIRRVAGNPNEEPGKKAFFLITHSPFMVDLRSVDDLRAVISFDLTQGMPGHMLDLDDQTAAVLSPLVSRLNVHHKQLFFSDNPIFVEGILDSTILQAIQERRGVSIASAGSCVIDAGGCEEVNKYLTLCRSLDKSAYFLYDLDALFTGTLRACIKSDSEVTDFLAAAGLGSEFGRYCGELDRRLTDAIKAVQTADPVPEPLAELRTYIDELSGSGWSDSNSLNKARVATLVQLHFDRDSLAELLTESAVCDIEGRLAQVRRALQQKNIFLLTGGALEHFLPSYGGHRFELDGAAKRAAVDAEVALLASELPAQDLPTRYGQLYDAIAALPSKSQVDTDPLVRRYLSDFIHAMQGLIVTHPGWGADDLEANLRSLQPSAFQLFGIKAFTKRANGFEALLSVKGLGGEPDRTVAVDESTNAGMQRFELRNVAAGGGDQASIASSSTADARL